MKQKQTMQAKPSNTDKSKQEKQNKANLAPTKQQINKNALKWIGNIAALALVLYVGIQYVLPNFLPEEKAENKTNQVTEATILENGDMSIALADIGDQAIFHSYEHEGTHVEVMSVMATDGSVRTAFNTCQVCYSSGHGYYVQEGNYLICQNCKNMFHRDMVEVAKGGCNPVPIFDEDITTTENEIIIPAAYLKEAAQLFDQWSRG